MKAILISINPKWVAKILNGEKTIEIRKTMPKCELPIDVYIYCTKGNGSDNLYFSLYHGEYRIAKNVDHKQQILNGKVVAKFTLNKVEEITTREDRFKEFIFYETSLDMEDLLKQSCLDYNELDNYLYAEKGYAWHISNLEIFDEPKELSNFFQAFKCRPCRGIGWRKHQVLYNYDLECLQQTTNSGYEYVYPIKQAPQSWCYVEVLGD